MKTNTNIVIDVGNGIEIVIFQRNDPQPIVYVDHEPMLLTDIPDQTAERRQPPPLINVVTSTERTRKNGHRFHTPRGVAPHNALTTPLDEMSHGEGSGDAPMQALLPLRKLAATIQKIAISMKNSSPTKSERSVRSERSQRNQQSQRSQRSGRRRAPATSDPGEVVPTMSREGRLIAVNIGRGEVVEEKEEEEHEIPLTLQEALKKISRLEAKNKILAREALKNDRKHEKMTDTMFKIGERMSGVCDKVQAVLQANNEAMMAEHMTAMETLIVVQDEQRYHVD
jgi:hypothetical protein